eukprot:m51a1_g2081 hypothetical protein (662) ;mRNA; f:1504036-1506800
MAAAELGDARGVLLAVVALAVACTTCARAQGPSSLGAGESCSGPDTDYYDSASSAIKFLPPAPGCTPDDAGGSVEVVEMFTPRSLPWNYTTICWKSLFGEQGSIRMGDPVNAFVVAYEETNGRPGRQLLRQAAALQAIVQPSWPSRRDSAAGATPRVPQRWYSVKIELLATSPRLFIGVVLVGTCTRRTSFFTSMFQTRSRAAAWRLPGSTAWNTFSGDWKTDNVTSVLVRARGKASEAVPAGWLCEARLYNNGVCNCKCGIWDPDCGISPISPDCDVSINKICNASGLCEGHWFPRALHCPQKVAKCGDHGECVEAWPDDACPASAFGSKAICDCSCQSGGVADPDCLSLNTSTCGDSAHCTLGACRSYPQAWTCSPDNYGTNDGCHCNCGIPDPGAGSSSPIGCASGGTYLQGSLWSCNAAGRCVTWDCGNGVLETSVFEECDNGTGCKSCRFCSGCGNGRLEVDEVCDGGEGCSSSCQCVQGYEPTQPLTIGCLVTVINKTHGTKVEYVAVYVAAPVGGVAIVAVSGLVVAGLLVFKKRNRQAPNLPVDLNSIEFIPASITGTVDLETPPDNASPSICSALPLPFVGLSSDGSSGHVVRQNSSTGSDLSNVIVPSQVSSCLSVPPPPGQGPTATPLSLSLQSSEAASAHSAVPVATVK